MTREEAIQIAMNTPSRLIERLRQDKPQWLCDILAREAAEDSIDQYIALGILKCDEPTP